MAYISPNPIKELQTAFNKAERPAGSMGKLRVYCLLLAPAHLANVVVKPIIYTALAVGCLALTLLCIAGDGYHLVPEFAKRTILYTCCAVVAPVGQVFQLYKATLGVFNPNIYFAPGRRPRLALDPLKAEMDSEPLRPMRYYASKLVEHVDEVVEKGGLSVIQSNALSRLRSYLDHNVFKDRIDSTIRFNPAYSVSLPQSGLESYRTLCKRFSEEDFPLEKKKEALLRYESERHQCVPGEANLLTDICSALDEPADIALRIPWLIARYKVEVLRNLSSEKDVDANFINYLFKSKGELLGLPAAVIKTAKADCFADIHAHSHLVGLIISEYKTKISPKDLFSFIENYINEASSSRKAFRAEILGLMANEVSDELVAGAEENIKLKHAEAIAFEIEQARKRHLERFGPTADAIWEKTLADIKLKENPYIDHIMYANYHYRSNTKDMEDNRLTSEAIQWFIEPYLDDLHKEFSSSPI